MSFWGPKRQKTEKKIRKTFLTNDFHLIQIHELMPVLHTRFRVEGRNDFSLVCSTNCFETKTRDIPRLLFNSRCWNLLWLSVTNMKLHPAAASSHFWVWKWERGIKFSGLWTPVSWSAQMVNMWREPSFKLVDSWYFLLFVQLCVQHHASLCGRRPLWTGPGPLPGPGVSAGSWVQPGCGTQSGVYGPLLLHVWLLGPAASPWSSQLVWFWFTCLDLWLIGNIFPLLSLLHVCLAVLMTEWRCVITHWHDVTPALAHYKLHPFLILATHPKSKHGLIVFVADWFELNNLD